MLTFLGSYDCQGWRSEYCNRTETYFENGQMSRQNIHADYIGHGEFETEENRNCKTCNCCEAVTPIIGSVDIPYSGNTNASFVCVTGYAPGCSAGASPAGSGQQTAEGIPQPDESIKFFDDNGNVRYEGKRIYTVQEAVEVSGPKNRFRIKYK